MRPSANNSGRERFLAADKWSEVPALPPEEELSLEDLDDEDELEENAGILDEEGAKDAN